MFGAETTGLPPEVSTEWQLQEQQESACFTTGVLGLVVPGPLGLSFGAALHFPYAC